MFNLKYILHHLEVFSDCFTTPCYFTRITTTVAVSPPSENVLEYPKAPHSSTLIVFLAEVVKSSFLLR